LKPVRPAPEIRVAVTSAGRETLDAIADELGMAPRKAPQRSLRRPSPTPEIVVSEVPAGRDTLAAIAEEMRAGPREPLTTLPYGDRLSNAPGAVTPSKPPAQRSRPDATRPDDRAPEAERGSATPELFEMITFLVRHPEPSALSSDEARRRFVEERLLHRLPDRTMSSVTRIDVTPWTERDTVILRVWCQVGPNS
jgi:hypothetical protein